MNLRYNYTHQKIRAAWDQRIQQGGVLCSRCNMEILPGTDWHLDHNDDGVGYRGPSHARCNISANEGGTRARRAARVSDDELYCGRANAAVGTISSNGHSIKTRTGDGGWCPLWAYQLHQREAAEPAEDRADWL